MIQICNTQNVSEALGSQYHLMITCIKSWLQPSYSAMCFNPCCNSYHTAVWVPEAGIWRSSIRQKDFLPPYWDLKQQLDIIRKLSYVFTKVQTIINNISYMPGRTGACDRLSHCYVENIRSKQLGNMENMKRKGIQEYWHTFSADESIERTGFRQLW